MVGGGVGEGGEEESFTTRGVTEGLFAYFGYYSLLPYYLMSYRVYLHPWVTTVRCG